MPLLSVGGKSEALLRLHKRTGLSIISNTSYLAARSFEQKVQSLCMRTIKKDMVHKLKFVISHEVLKAAISLKTLQAIVDSMQDC